MTEESWEDVFNLTTFIYPECGAFPDISRVKVTRSKKFQQKEQIKNYFQEWKFWLSGVATLVTGVFGIFGNAVSLLVLCKR